jgi:hypothetical protein
MIHQLVLFAIAVSVYWIIEGRASLLASLISTASQLLLIFLPIVLSIAILSPITKGNHLLLVRCFGYKAYVVLVSLSTILHEASHAVMCIIFNHQITQFKPFPVERKTGGTGYVSHRWNSRSTYQSIGNFFIGIAPMITGYAIIYLSASLLFGYQGLRQYPGSVHSFFATLVQGIKSLPRPECLVDIRFYVFITVAIFIGNSITPSWSDMKNSAMGIIALALILFISNAAIHMTKVGAGSYIRFGSAILFMAVNICLFLIVVNGILYLLLKAVQTVMKGRS